MEKYFPDNPKYFEFKIYKKSYNFNPKCIVLGNVNNSKSLEFRVIQFIVQLFPFDVSPITPLNGILNNACINPIKIKYRSIYVVYFKISNVFFTYTT